MDSDGAHASTLRGRRKGSNLISVRMSVRAAYGADQLRFRVPFCSLRRLRETDSFAVGVLFVVDATTS